MRSQKEHGKRHFSKSVYKHYQSNYNLFTPSLLAFCQLLNLRLCPCSFRLPPPFSSSRSPRLSFWLLVSRNSDLGPTEFYSQACVFRVVPFEWLCISLYFEKVNIMSDQSSLLLFMGRVLLYVFLLAFVCVVHVTSPSTLSLFIFM